MSSSIGSGVAPEELLVLAAVSEGAWLRLARRSHDEVDGRQPNVRDVSPAPRDASPTEILGTVAALELRAPAGHDDPPSLPKKTSEDNLPSSREGEGLVGREMAAGGPLRDEVDCDEVATAMWTNSLREQQISLATKREITTTPADLVRRSRMRAVGNAEALFEREMAQRTRREEALALQRRMLAEEEMKQCSFAPQVTALASTSASPAVAAHGSHRAADLYRSHASRLLRREQLALEAAEREKAACSFAPVLNNAGGRTTGVRRSPSPRLGPTQGDHFGEWQAAKERRLEERRREQLQAELAAVRAAPTICGRSAALASMQSVNADVADRLTQTAKDMQRRAEEARRAADLEAKAAADVRRHIPSSSPARRASPSSAPHENTAGGCVHPEGGVHERLFHDSPSGRPLSRSSFSPTSLYRPALCPRSLQLVGAAIQRSSTPVYDRLIAEGREASARRQRERDAAAASRTAEASPCQTGGDTSPSRSGGVSEAQVAALRRSFGAEEKTPPPPTFAPTINRVSEIIDAASLRSEANRGKLLLTRHVQRERRHALAQLEQQKQHETPQH
jgi:hypothetical protein